MKIIGMVVVIVVSHKKSLSSEAGPRGAVDIIENDLASRPHPDDGGKYPKNGQIFQVWIIGIRPKPWFS